MAFGVRSKTKESTMAFSSVQSLTLHLISSAFQRCRLSEQICRLSVIFNRSSPSLLQLVRISISDTGIGSCLEEFQDLKLSGEADSENWDGVLSVKTTSSDDNEIHHYQLNLKERGSSRRLNRLPSNTKNGAKFSGTEVCLAVPLNIDLLLAQITSFLQKILILKIHNVAIELVAENGDVPESRYEKVFLANQLPLPIVASNLELLKSGLEDYVVKHGNRLSTTCNSCFPSGEHLKVGVGIACCTKNHLYNGVMMEAVIVISEKQLTSTCPMVYGAKTEVLYFKNFSPYTISKASIKALKSIDWRRYGLNLRSALQQDSSALLEWENLPPYAQIDIVLHCYHKDKRMRLTAREKTQLERKLIREAVKLSLDDLKDKHVGVLLSAHALKIRSYAPDLAKTIAGLILSSGDSDFQGECFSLLGLQSQGLGTETVENSIKDKIVSVIDMNDKSTQKTKDVTSFLFYDDRFHQVDFEEMEYEDDFSPLDI
ncbi:Type 2 DNA topoisomerase 6 subunit B-like protein [Quillaja saponaria]|uniref:Type 2 DNA topoisomerase 6 subunit B-like protein n=1 Tax=Quillaja saponaria TaxID=32244 RepID=A0AAD7KQY2_QUISA|nr:Type 2 DNA topoisomerase 6 subunit B-like protein [Quillaja saponaria]